MIKILL